MAVIYIYIYRSSLGGIIVLMPDINLENLLIGNNLVDMIDNYSKLEVGRLIVIYFL